MSSAQNFYKSLATFALLAASAPRTFFSSAFTPSVSLMSSSSASSNLSTSSSSASCSPLLSLEDRKRSALLGLYIFDAIASPVHWMYDLNNLKADYGKITNYVKPKDAFRGSIMNLSNTGGGGRGSDAKSIIGDVINHNKKKYWLRGGNFHYHIGLQKGENTLEAQLTRLMVRTISGNERREFDGREFLEKYVAFMTTEGSHNDTYASTAHRDFFKNWVLNMPLEKCADNDGHNTEAIDALTLTVPLIVHYASSPTVSRLELKNMVKLCIKLTRRTDALDGYAEAWTDLLADVLLGRDLRETVEEVSVKYLRNSVARDVSNSRGDPMVACYMGSSFPALLHFAYKYSDSLEAAALANANAGGENVARGSCLGALMGAALGRKGVEENGMWMVKGLYQGGIIEEEIRQLVLGEVEEVGGEKGNL